MLSKAKSARLESTRQVEALPRRDEGKKKRVVVALSGGVDSAVAAFLLKKQGYEIIGMFMKLWAEDENRCCDINSLECARKTAAKLSIPFYVVDLKKEFKKIVVNDYLCQYSQCKTPNPCVICNKFIKFDLLFKKAKGLGAEFLATGHYARIARELKTKKLKLKISKDKNKDQTYFLWTLTQNQLKQILFPIGDYTKKEVRNIALKNHLPSFNRPESQGICFLGNMNQKEFLSRFIKFKAGPIVDLRGDVIGKHAGLPFYTIGQRKGLTELRIKNKELRKKGETPPMYVVKMDQKNNTLIVGEEKELYKKELFVKNINWISGRPPKTRNVGAKIRYGHPIVKSKITNPKSKNKIEIIFNRPVRAVTPGQSIVFYSQDEVLGGGIIWK